MGFFDKDMPGFRGIDLQSLNAMGLMKRFDTKFVFHRDKLSSVLKGMCQDYQVLEMDGRRTFAYKTLYYDTYGHLLYRQHHDKRVNRYKIRCRNYSDTQQCFVEVKCKNNKKKTIKKRRSLDGGMIQHDLPEQARAFVRNCLSANGQALIHDLKPSLWVNYTRMTMADPLKQERITFDVDLTFEDDSDCLCLDNLVVAELKHPRYGFKSAFSLMMKGLNILPAQFSKYCMGIVLLGKNPRYNRFKEQVLALKKAGVIQGFDFSVIHGPLVSGGDLQERLHLWRAPADFFFPDVDVI